MAVTLLEAAKSVNNELRQAIIELYAMSHPLLDAMRFDDISGNSISYNREDTLPGIGFRGVNEAYTESTGVINPQTERLVIAGGDLDVDKFIIRTVGPGQRGVQESMKVKHLAHKWAYTFIKGDAETDPKEFDGLQNRIAGNQLIAAGSTSGGDALSLAKLDELMDAVDDPTHLLMSKAMRRRLTAAARSTSVGGYVTYDKDAFGRRVTQYNDVPILVMDGNNQYYATLAFNEANPGGGSSVGTSIYAVEIRDGMLSGIQNGTMEVTDLGELQTKPCMRTRIEWYSAFAIWNPRSVARLYGIKNAAVTA